MNGYHYPLYPCPVSYAFPHFFFLYLCTYNSTRDIWHKRKNEREREREREKRERERERERVLVNDKIHITYLPFPPVHYHHPPPPLLLVLFQWRLWMGTIEMNDIFTEILANEDVVPGC